MRPLVAIAALTLTACSAPIDSVALENLICGKARYFAYDDPSQPWPCGQPGATLFEGCEPAWTFCETEYQVWQCEGFQLTVDYDNLLLIAESPGCYDEHPIHLATEP